MIKKQPYKDINDTVRHIKIQILDGMDYALNNCPSFKDPEALFTWLKKRVTYKNDPKGTELLQTLPTLLEDNWHNIPGAGDCDCFTIAFVTLAIAQGWKNIKIVLVGRNAKTPVHIYNVIYWKGRRLVCDLTNKTFNHERDNYTHIQEIPVNWEKW